MAGSVMRTRQNHRKPLTLPGKYYSGKGGAVEVTLGDISRGGCSFEKGRHRLEQGAPIRIYIDNAGPFAARVRWVEGEQAGVTFDPPLEAEQLAHFRNCHVARRPTREELVNPGTLAASRPRFHC